MFFIFEYTGESGFLSVHQKIIEESRSVDSDIRIVDLLRLNKKEFLYLLKQYVRDDIEQESDEFVRWNGNLRLVRELKDQVYVERPIDEPNLTAPLISDLRILIHDRIQRLSNVAKLVLACVVCHVEALPETVLIAAILKIDGSFDKVSIDQAVIELMNGSRYLRSVNGRLSISDEDVASVMVDGPFFARFRALAERSLREVYLGVLAGDRIISVALPLAYRQAISLCLATGDSTALARLIRTLAQGARSAHDQEMYVSLVADALFRRTGVGLPPNSELVEWAAATAYEIGDYRLSAELVEIAPVRDAFHECLLGFCYGETNRHEDAVQIGRALQSGHAEASPIYVLGRLVQLGACPDRQCGRAFNAR